jgi:hypothetical protein
VTETTDPAARATTVVRYRVASEDKNELTIRVETSVGGVPVASTETRLALDAEAARARAIPADAPRESVVVRAGTFSCRHLHREDGGVLDEWVAPGLPVPVKSVWKGPRATSTTELIRSVNE